MSLEEIIAVNKVVRLEKDYAQLSDYVKNSLYMTMDPYNVSIARLQYWVDTDYEVNYAGITEKDRTDDIVDAFIYSVEDGKWRKNALKAIGADIDVAYFSELVTISDYGDSFIVNIKYPDEEQLGKIVEVLKEEIQSYHEKLEGIYGNHELNIVNESIEVTVDNDIYNMQQTRKNALLSFENNIANYKNAFNDNQKSLYSGEILVNEEEQTAEEAAAQAEAEMQASPPAPQIRVKYILLGAILGAFLICMIRAMVYILSGKLKAEDNIDSYLGIPGLGCIEENQKEAKNIVDKIDAWLESFSKRGSANLTKEQQLKMTVSNILFYCEKGGMKQIYLNSSTNCVEEKAGEIISMLKERGIEVKSGFSILQDAFAMEEMSKADGIIFMEQAGKSRYEDLEREVKLCKEHEKAVIGLIVLS